MAGRWWCGSIHLVSVTTTMRTTRRARSTGSRKLMALRRPTRWKADGAWKEASTETRRALLAALGVDATGEAGDAQRQPHFAKTEAVHGGEANAHCHLPPWLDKGRCWAATCAALRAALGAQRGYRRFRRSRRARSCTLPAAVPTSSASRRCTRCFPVIRRDAVLMPRRAGGFSIRFISRWTGWIARRVVRRRRSQRWMMDRSWRTRGGASPARRVRRRVSGIPGGRIGRVGGACLRPVRGGARGSLAALCLLRGGSRKPCRWRTARREQGGGRGRPSCRMQPVPRSPRSPRRIEIACGFTLGCSGSRIGSCAEGQRGRGPTGCGSAFISTSPSASHPTAPTRGRAGTCSYRRAGRRPARLVQLRRPSVGAVADLAAVLASGVRTFFRSAIAQHRARLPGRCASTTRWRSSGCF